MHTDRFDDLKSHREHRVQCRHRFLEDHADASAAHVAHLFFGYR